MSKEEFPAIRDVEKSTSPTGDIDDPILALQAREEQALRDRQERAKAANIPEQFFDQLPEPEQTLVRKGESIDLLSKTPSLRRLTIGAGWTGKSLDQSIDIDLSMFLLDKNDMTREDGDFIFYNQMTTLEGAVKHSGDTREAAGAGDEESIYLDLNGVPYTVMKIVFVLTAYDEIEGGYHFGQVRNVYLRLVNEEYGEELCRFNLPDEYAGKSGIYAGELLREGPRWVFHALGHSIERGGLGRIAHSYGIIIKELASTGK